MTRPSPIDRRPFRSKADHEREQALETQYRSLAIRCVVAAKAAEKASAKAPQSDKPDPSAV